METREEKLKILEDLGYKYNGLLNSYDLLIEKPYRKIIRIVSEVLSHDEKIKDVHDWLIKNDTEETAEKAVL